jgi:hypothetical protein
MWGRVRIEGAGNLPVAPVLEVVGEEDHGCSGAEETLP